MISPKVRWLQTSVCMLSVRTDMVGFSPEDTARVEGQDLVAIEEELRAGEGCAISGLENRLADPESHGSRRGELS